MARSIEDQIHQYFKDQEEARCRKLEAERQASSGSPTKIVRRRDIPKPWTRPHTNSLCQEGDLLLLVKELDYQLSDGAFQEYCEDRGVLHVAGEPDSRRWEFFFDYTKTKEEYLADSFFRFAGELGGKRQRYTSQEVEVGWKVIQLGRARLQDCWELFRSKNQE